MAALGDLEACARGGLAAFILLILSACGGGNSPIPEDAYRDLRAAVQEQCAEREHRFFADPFEVLDEDGQATLSCTGSSVTPGLNAKFARETETLAVLISAQYQDEAGTGLSGRPASYIGDGFWVLSCRTSLLADTAKSVGDVLGHPYNENTLRVPPAHLTERCDEAVTENGSLYGTYAVG